MRGRMRKSIFIIGTDTGVGKTVVTGAYSAWLNANGVRCGAFKPLEAGRGRGDSKFLKKMAGMNEPLRDINPYYFKEPLAPGIAAERGKKKISFTKIKKALQKLLIKYDLVLIEGAGGLLAPINHLQTNLDLIKFLKCPVLVVARLGLGTLNHTLLTLEHLKRNKIKILGVILNDQSSQKGVAEKTNPDVLRRYGVPLLGIFPYLKTISKKSLVDGACS